MSLNNIVTVNVSISSPAVDSASFDNLLILGLPPVKTPLRPLPDVGVYSDLSEVSGAGYETVGSGADPVGIAARIAFSQNPKPSRIFIAALREGGDTLLESVTDTLNRALETTGWYVICPAGIPESDFELIAEWTEAQVKLFAYTFLSGADPVPPVYFRSHGWCGLIGDDDQPSDVPDSNSYLHCAIAAKALSHPAGSETWAFKQLAAVHPSALSGTLLKSLTEGDSNYFTRLAGRNVSMNGKVRGGEWIDVIRGRDWLQNDMQLRIFNLLIMNPKIPYTNSGISLVEAQMMASLKAATERSIVAEDEFDADGALVPGFTTNVPNSMNLTATQRASRVLQDCRFSARLAGAIHCIRVDGGLTY